MTDRFQQFSAAMSSINQYVLKLQREEMEKYGYKGAFAQYLMAMRRNPDGVTSAQLSEMCDKDKAAVSRVITEMIEKGLVVRKSANEKLYRAKLSLTQKGTEIADYIANQGAAAVVAVNNAFSQEELKAFYSNLDYIAERLHTISKDGIPDK